MTKGIARLSRALVIAAFGAFLVIFGHRLAIVNELGVNLPSYDQWRGEADAAYLPWQLGALSAQQIFEPWGEHRIVTTRLLGLSLLAWNGVWDVRLHLVVSAILFAGSWVLLGLALGRGLGRPVRVLLLACGALLTLPCFAPDNALFAFQSQIYFALLFQWLALWLLVTRPALSPAWWAGLLPALLAYSSFGSGLGATAVAASVAAIRAGADAEQRPRALAAALVLGALSVAFIAATPRAVDLAPMHATTPAAFGVAVAELLAWPFVDLPWMAAFVAAPWLALAVGWLREPDDERSLAVALGAWIVTQAVMIAYGRSGGEEAFPASRYIDFVLPGILLGLTCFAWLLRDVRMRPLVAGAFSFWILMVGAGVALAAAPALEERLWLSVGQQAQWRYVNLFFRTDDDRALLEAPPGAIPIDDRDAAHLVSLLRNRALVAILPSALTGAPAAADAPLSRASELTLAHAAWVRGLGIVLLAVPMAVVLRRSRPRARTRNA